MIELSPEATGYDVAERACKEAGDDPACFDGLRVTVDSARLAYGEAHRARGMSEADAVEMMRRFNNGAEPLVLSHIRFRTLSDDDLVHDTHEMIVSFEEAGILLPLLRRAEVNEKLWYRAVMGFRKAECSTSQKVHSGTMGATREIALQNLATAEAMVKAEHDADRSNRRSTDEEHEAGALGFRASIERAILRYYGPPARRRLRPEDFDCLPTGPARP